MTTEPNDTSFDVLVPNTDPTGDDVPGTLTVMVTDEGVICDLRRDGSDDVIATWGQTAQELADDHCH